MVHADLVGEAERLATVLARRAAELETAPERARRHSLGRVVGDRAAIAATVRLLDRSLRPSRPGRAAALVASLGARPPRALGARRRMLLGAFARAWPAAPAAAMALVRAGLRAETADLVGDADPDAVSALLSRHRERGVAVNLNPIGEAVVSDAEARSRFAAVAALLADARVDAVSVKASALRARMTPLDHEAVVRDLATALRSLYGLAGDRLVALDMEEYRDLEPTLEAFTSVMGEVRYRNRIHGIALQAYLPDSGAALTDLAQLGARRVDCGGAPVRVRLVKGANLGAERLDADLHGWPAAPFPDKDATDANMKRLVAWALDPARTGLHVGVGSHNVFDVAWALTVAGACGTTDCLTVEMLAGMADPLLRAVAEVAPAVLVYAPVAADADFLAAVAYLVRRLDEQTSEGNFLRASFSLAVGDAEWERQRGAFERACASAAAEPAPRSPSRRASADPAERPAASEPSQPFTNVADTDWAVATNRRSLAAALAAAHLPPLPPPAPPEAALRAVADAAADADGWAQRSLAARREVLCRAAAILQRRRLDLVALMAVEAAKTPAEGDREVSEAVDACNYYARALDFLDSDPALVCEPRGVVAVVSPWNFPLAVPIGGVAAALVGGNRVVLKPSPHTVRTALAGATALWDAGVPPSALSVVHAGTATAAALTAADGVDAVVFTGSTNTAAAIVASRRGRTVFAETGGKNAIVVTDAADRDLAVRDVLTSAFSHSGQKCSAASFVVCEAPVFDDPAFRRRLVDAVASLRTGPATDAAVDVAPQVIDPNPALAALYSRLTPGEWWALEPRRLGPRHRTPGVVWDVQPGSAAHVAELFGPVVGVMRAADLDEAIALVNASGYGLTSGLQSLDEDEWGHWLAGVEAGNLYVNRPTTGAIVGRQPFGGWRLSGFGPGAKAGGRHYASQLVTVRAAPGHETGTRPAWQRPFTEMLIENAGIPGQANLTRWLPAPGVVVRFEEADNPAVLEHRLRAAAAVGCGVDVSRGAHEPVEVLCARLGNVSRLVMCGPAVPPALADAAARSWTSVCTDAPTGTELDQLAFVREQTVSADLHRYGWLPPDARIPLP